MSKGRNKLLTFTQSHKSLKIVLVIYADRESLLHKMQACDNDPKKLVAWKINK